MVGVKNLQLLSMKFSLLGLLSRNYEFRVYGSPGVRVLGFRV